MAVAPLLIAGTVGYLAARRKNKKQQQQAQPQPEAEATTTLGDTTPEPPSTPQSTSNATREAQKAAQRTRRRAAAGSAGRVSPMQGGATGTQRAIQPLSSATSLIGG